MFRVPFYFTNVRLSSRILTLDDFFFFYGLALEFFLSLEASKTLVQSFPLLILLTVSIVLHVELHKHFK